MAVCETLNLRYRFSMRQGVGEDADCVRRQLAALERMAGLGLDPQQITVNPMFEYPGARWLPADCPRLNRASDAYPIEHRRLDPPTIAAWREVLAFCREHGWIKP